MWLYVPIQLHPGPNLQTEMAWFQFYLVHYLVSQASILLNNVCRNQTLLTVRSRKELKTFSHRHRYVGTFSTIQLYLYPNVQTKMRCLQTYQLQMVSFWIPILKGSKQLNRFLPSCLPKQAASPKKEVQLSLYIHMLHWKYADAYSLFCIWTFSRTSVRQRKNLL